MLIDIPELSVITLIGKESKEKYEFIKRYFDKEELLEEDAIEDGLGNRLEEGKLTAINVTSKEAKIYENIIRLAKKYHCKPVVIMFDPMSMVEKNKAYDKGVVSVNEQDQVVQELVDKLEKKGFRQIIVLDTEEQIQKAEVQRVKLAVDLRDVHGPFDIIGDIHGCYDELCELLRKLGYVVDEAHHKAYSQHNRKVVLVGDLVDRGPKSPEVLKIVMYMVKNKEAYCVLGNHDGKLQRKLKGSNVQIAHGLEKTLEQLEHESEQFIEEVQQFLDCLVSHYIFDKGNLVVAHAGLKEKLHGRESKKIRDLAMFGQTTGELDEFGLPVRLNWSEHYKGSAWVTYGHTPREQVNIVNNTINIDTGCVFGGRLTAFRYPENEIVDVPAKHVYYESVRPLSR